MMYPMTFKNSVSNSASRPLALRKLALGALVMACSAWAHAQNAIESVAASIQGGVEVVRIEMTQPLTAVPTGDRKSTRLNSSHRNTSRMPSSA